jgi:hypothetical protein
MCRVIRGLKIAERCLRFRLNYLKKQDNHGYVVKLHPLKN